MPNLRDKQTEVWADGVSPKVCADAQSLNCVLLCATPWTETRQPPLSVGCSRQEHWSGCHALLRGIFPTRGSNLSLPCLLRWQVNSLPLSHRGQGSKVLHAPVSDKTELVLGSSSLLCILFLLKKKFFFCSLDKA